MKILHTADLHIGEDLFTSLGSKAAEERYKDILDSLEQIKQIAVTENVDVVLVAGDVFNRVLPSGNASLHFSEFLKFFLDKQIHVIIIRGNHDRPANDSASELLKTYRILLSRTQENYFHYLGKIESIMIQTKDKRTVGFVALPYYPVELEYEGVKDAEEIFQRAKDVQRQARIDEIKKEIFRRVEGERAKIKADYYILGAHIPIIGSIPGSERRFYGSRSEITYGANEVCRLPFDYIALGHFHIMQTVGSDNCWYSGSVFRLTFDEPSYIDGRRLSRSEKGVIIVEERNGKLSSRITPLNTRDMCLVHLSLPNRTYDTTIINTEQILDSIMKKCPIYEPTKGPCVKVEVKLPNTMRKTFDRYTLEQELLKKGYLHVKIEVLSEETKVSQVVSKSLPVKEALPKYIRSIDIPQALKEEVIKEALKIIDEVMEE
ncbi:MAG: exonuclease SbcCD subunit D [Nitrososphaeria archaeon]